MKQIVKQIQVYHLIKLNKERGFLILSIVCLLNVEILSGFLMFFCGKMVNVEHCTLQLDLQSICWYIACYINKVYIEFSPPISLSK